MVEEFLFSEIPEISPGFEPPEEILLTRVDVARHCSVHARTVSTWFEDGLPKPPVSKAVVDAWIDGRRGQGSKAAADPEVDAARRRESIAKADLAQAKAGRAAGKLVGIAEIEEVLLPYLTACGQLLEQVPEKLLALNGADPKDFLSGARRMIDDARSQLSAAAASIAGRGGEG